MLIKLGRVTHSNREPEYINHININFKYNNLDLELNVKYKEILKNIHSLNRGGGVEINVTASNSVTLKDLEIDYSIELKPYQYPSAELNNFYSNFNSFLIGYKKEYELSLANKENNALDKLVSKLDEMIDSNTPNADKFEYPTLEGEEQIYTRKKVLK